MNLIELVKQGRIERVRELLEGGEDPNDGHPRSALWYATHGGNIDVIELLLDYGTNIDVRDNSGRTALMVASYDGNVHLIDLLLDRGASIDLRDYNGETALIHAAREDNDRAVRVLLERGADHKIYDHDDNSALCYAGYEGKGTVYDLLLLARRHCPDVEDSRGRTLLMNSSMNNDIDTVRLLLDWGANPGIKDDYGNTALTLADTEEMRDLIRLYPSSMVTNKDRSRDYMVGYDDLSFLFPL